MKTIESKIAPNPKEAQIWVDLSADPHGLVRKYWNGSKWVEKDKSDNDSKVIQHVDNELTNIKHMFESVCRNYDKTILQLTDKINSLVKRVNELEQIIIMD